MGGPYRCLRCQSPVVEDASGDKPRRVFPKKFKVVDSSDIGYAVQAVEVIAIGGRDGHQSRGIEPVKLLLKPRHDGNAVRAALYALFLVASRPDDDARVIAVSANEAIELLQAFLAAGEKTLFIHDENAETITGIE